MSLKYVEDLKYNKAFCKGKGPMLYYLKSVGYLALNIAATKLTPKILPPVWILKWCFFISRGDMAKLLYSGLFFYFQAAKQVTHQESHTGRKKKLLSCFILVYCPPWCQHVMSCLNRLQNPCSEHRKLSFMPMKIPCMWLSGYCSQFAYDYFSLSLLQFHWNLLKYSPQLKLSTHLLIYITQEFSHPYQSAKFYAP